MASSSAPSTSADGSKSLSLDEYLVQAKQDASTHLKTGSSSNGKLTLIMGNEAGDLDSGFLCNRAELPAVAVRGLRRVSTFRRRRMRH